MATVRVRTQRNGAKTYYVRTRDALGRQTTESFPGNKAAAERFARIVSAVGGPAAIQQRRREDAAGIEEYVPTLSERVPVHIEALTGVTDRTRLDYQSLAERTFLPLIGQLRIDMIDRSKIASVINALERRGLSAKTIANTHALLSSVFKVAVQDQVIAINPCVGMRLPRSGEEDREGPRFLARDEYVRLMEAMPVQHRPLTATLFGAGPRWSEATALRVRDVAAGPPPMLSIRRAWKVTPGKPKVIGPPKSHKSRRDALLSLEAFRLLDLDRDPDDLLFTAPRGGHVHYGAWRSRVWVPACIRAGLATPPVEGVPWRFDGPSIHDARHTHASWLLSTGQVSLEQLQDQLGHESILTTRKVYAHLLPESRNRLALVLNSLADERLLPPSPGVS